CAVVFIARYAGAVLRRRDRYGRQHLSGRSKRRADADAVECGPECGFFPNKPAPPLSADNRRSGFALRSLQRRGTAEQSVLHALVDEAIDRDAEEVQSVRPGDTRISLSGKPSCPCLYSSLS